MLVPGFGIGPSTTTRGDEARNCCTIWLMPCNHVGEYTWKW